MFTFFDIIFFLLIVVSERDGLKSKIDALEAMELELTDQNSELQVQISGKYTWCFHEFLFCYYFSIFPVISRIFSLTIFQ